jgi:site-specific recombinase XerD
LSDCRIHTLRHTHASRLVQNGLSVYEVREILGHTDIKTTMRYAHLEQRQVTSKARDVINRLNNRKARAHQRSCLDQKDQQTVEVEDR